MTPFERLVRAVEQDVTGEEGIPPERYELALREARLYTEAVLRALHSDHQVRSVLVERLERSAVLDVFGACEFDVDGCVHDVPDPPEVVGEVLDALAELSRPPVGATR